MTWEYQPPHGTSPEDISSIVLRLLIGPDASGGQPVAARPGLAILLRVRDGLEALPEHANAG